MAAVAPRKLVVSAPVDIRDRIVSEPYRGVRSVYELLGAPQRFSIAPERDVLRVIGAGWE
jgi:hypothetical protein